MKFEDFIKSGEVKQRHKDTSLAKSLIKSGEDHLNFVKKHVIDKDNAAILLSDAYESVREAADAQLALQGFRSYSHIATILFLHKFNQLSTAELECFDKLRVKRNRAKYYAEPVTIDAAVESIEFAKIMLAKLKFILEQQLGGKDERRS